MKTRTIIIVAVAVFVLYLAGYGPAYRAWAFGNTPEPIHRIIKITYTPLWWLCDRSETVRECVDGYAAWWCEVR
ncbi:hypothetical protein [Symmachiella macrocystis]|nr:hypothetical protein [Symmachiella macrocystis]